MSLLAFALLLTAAPGFSYTEAEFAGRLAASRAGVARPASSGAGGATASQRKGGNSKSPVRKRYRLAPEIIIIGLDGKNILLGEMRGKVVVIDFWASWCPPCRRMIPIFNSLHEKYRNRGLEVIGISMDEGTTADLKGLANEFGVRYTAADGDPETEEAFRVEALPTTLLIDRRGRVRARHQGAIGQAQLEREVKKLLAE